MERGIRQGCPVSALLFILVVEVLAINIRENKNIHGLEAAFIHKKQYIKLSQYAEDCTVFLKNKANIKELLAEIKYFTDAAGLELNINKTIGIDLTETDDYDYLGIRFTSKPVKCLGIYVGKNDKACQDLNWSKKNDILEKTPDMWKKRELSLFGKILIIKTLAISKITFLLLNLLPPNNIIKKIKTLLFNFIWGKRDRIKRHILRQDIIHGGVNMIDMLAR